MRSYTFSLGIAFSLVLGLGAVSQAEEGYYNSLRQVGYADPELPATEVRRVAAQDPIGEGVEPEGIPGQKSLRTARSIYNRQPEAIPMMDDAAEAAEALPRQPRAAAEEAAPKRALKPAPTQEEYVESSEYYDDHSDGYCEDGSCGTSCGDGCGGCCGFGFGGQIGFFGERRGGPWFADADYLNWWTQGMDLPPLVVRVNNGAANVIYGNQKVLTDDRSGYRLRLGKWFDECRTSGIQGEFLQLATASDYFQASSNALGRPQLGRPFIEANTGAQFIEDVSIPNQLAGSVSVESRGSFSSAGLRWIQNLCCNDLGCGNTGRLDFLMGYRYLQLDESLLIHEDLVSILPDPNQGRFLIDDRFQTYNDFNGGEFGWMWERDFGRWNFNGTAKLAVGSTHQVVRISGQTTTSGASDPTDNGTRPGGLLTQVTNIGTYSRDKFALVPELALNLGYQITPALRVQVGYTFIYWSNVVRPGDQIDLTVNQNLIPERSFPLTNPTFTGPARPAFTFRDTDFWAQGINVGLHLEY